MRIDLELPMSTLWLTEGDLQFTNLEGVTLQWKANDTIDIQAYLIEYRIVGNDTWNDFGAFTSPGEFWFSPEGDAKFEIRSRTVDYAGNKENKPTPDVVVTFDRLNPNLELNFIDKLTGSDELLISVKFSLEDLTLISNSSEPVSLSIKFNSRFGFSRSNVTTTSGVGLFSLFPA
jgi:hypothetical protein